MCVTFMLHSFVVVVGRMCVTVSLYKMYMVDLFAKYCIVCTTILY